MGRTKAYWLLKTEPTTFSIQDLAAADKQTTCWDGVRNYQARNFLREFQEGERVLLYHSSTDPTAVVGTAIVVQEAYPDTTAFDKKDPHYDPKSKPENPTWFMVDIRLERIFPRPITLQELRQVPALASMELLRKGSRLSVQPVTKEEFETIVRLGNKKGKSS